MKKIRKNKKNKNKQEPKEKQTVCPLWKSNFVQYN